MIKTRSCIRVVIEVKIDCYRIMILSSSWCGGVSALTWQINYFANRHVDKSEFLRIALHRHLIRLTSEVDADLWEQIPHSTEEMALAEIADWGVAEDWVDWADEAR